MEEIFGIKLLNGSQISIEVENTTYSYDYVVIAKDISQNSKGGGWAQLTFYDTFKKREVDVVKDGWKVKSNVTIQINQGGAVLYPYVIDPNGLERQVKKNGHGKSPRSKQMNFKDDVEAVLRILEYHSNYGTWCDYDVHWAVESKNKIIEKLQAKVSELEEKLLQANGNG